MPSPSPMIENSNHYRFLMFKKLFQSNLWKNDKMFFQCHVLVPAPANSGLATRELRLKVGTNLIEVGYGLGVSTFTQPAADIAAFIASVEGIPEFWSLLQTSYLSVHGFDIKLSGSGIRGRAPHNLISANSRGETTSMRTVFCAPPNGAGISRDAMALYRIWSGANQDATMTPYMATLPFPSGLSREAMETALNGPQSVDGQYFWTDRETLTYRPLTEVLAALEDSFESVFRPLYNIVNNRPFFLTIQQAIADTATARMAAQRAALEVERQARRTAELARIQRLEAERMAQAANVLNNIHKFAEIFENTIPNRRKKGEKSIENMGNFLNSIEDLSIVTETDDDNPLTPSVSLDYNNGALLSLVANENGVFIENLNIPQEKMLQFVKMIKEL